MQFTATQWELAEGLNRVIGAVEKKTTMPILGTVLVTATTDGLSLRATDLEVGMEVNVKADVKTPGAISIPAKRLMDYISKLPDGDVTVKEGASYWVNISSGSAKSRIAGMDPAAFPDAPESPDTQATVPSAALVKLIKQGGYAFSTEQSRFTLNGSLVELVDGVLRVVSTDGHRLALAEVPQEGDNVRVIIPTRGLQELAKSAGAAGIGTAVTVAINSDRAYFTVGNVRLFCRLLSGQFPDYKRVLPQLPHSLTASRADLYSVIGRVIDFADSNTKAIKASIAGNRITLSSALSNVGDCEEGVPCETDGPDTPIGMNGLYLQEALKVIDTEKVQIKWKDERTAIQVLPVGGTSTAFSVVMPMHVAKPKEA